MISRYFTRYRSQLKELSPKDDRQAYSVYNLERRFLGGYAVTDQLNHTQVRAIVDYVCKKHKVPTIPLISLVHLGKNANSGEYYTMEMLVLNLDKTGAVVPTVLHEVAHHICDCRSYGGEDHGPEFVGVLRMLYDRYNILPKECFDVLADQYGLVWKDIRK